MKKLLFFGLIFCAVLTTFAQRTESYTNRVIQPTYLRYLQRTGTSTYGYVESPSLNIGDIKIGLSTPNLYGCGFVVYDLASILGTNPNATSATLRVKLYNSAGQPPSLIYGIITLDNGIINSSESLQWQSIAQGSSTSSQNYNQVLEYNIASLINSNSSSGKVTIGFRSDNIGQMYDAIQYAEISFTGTATVQEQISVSVKNNFNSGKIKAGVDTPPTSISNSPVTITNMTSKTLYMEAVEGSSQPVFENYARVFNDTEGPTNPSNWRKEDQSGVPQGNFSSSFSTSITLYSSENNYSYVADMKKLCNATFQAGTSLTVNGSLRTSPWIEPVVEQNSVTATAEEYFVSPDWISNSFYNWTWSGGSSTSITITPTVTAHTTYTANYIGTANQSPMNLHYTSSNGQPISLAWTEHPSTGVTQYQVWRTVTGVSTLAIATLNRGTTSYTDYSYTQNPNGAAKLFYTVKAYYAPSGTWNDPAYLLNRGDFTIENIVNNNDQLNASVKELPTEYSIGNYPNPFNPTTTINYQLPENSFVTIKVYDILGKEITTLVNESKSAGYHNVSFDANRLTSGIYIYTMQAGKYSESKKMILTK